jgi:hypothetical protein
MAASGIALDDKSSSMSTTESDTNPGMFVDEQAGEVDAIEGGSTGTLTAGYGGVSGKGYILLTL